MSDFENLANYDSSEHEPERLGGRDIAFLAAGIGIGAGLMLLFAPKRGHEVRRAIGRQCRRAVDSLTDRAYDLRERAQDLRERAEDLRDQAPNVLRFARRMRRRERRMREA